MEKDEVALEIRDDSEALRYSGKDRTLIIYLRVFSFLELTTYQVENKSYSYLQCMLFTLQMCH